ncbi:MAG: N-acetyltransferase [Clostridia bacterium]|nr:N-acetyltransferase [Clostridia bacterium]
MDGYTFRLERPDDYAAVEAVTREAFWNVYKPGCDEHYILHTMRGDPAVIEELNYVCEAPNGEICGHIFYTRTKVVSEDQIVYPVISFGPISVHPACQRLGIGSNLIRISLDKAKEMQFSGVLITGNPQYYHRFGFRQAADYGIVADDGSSFSELMAVELMEHTFASVHGRIWFCQQFSQIDPDALSRFDEQFPPKARMKLQGQLS